MTVTLPSQEMSWGVRLDLDKLIKENSRRCVQHKGEEPEKSTTFCHPLT